jgi:hypothetical protein
MEETKLSGFKRIGFRESKKKIFEILSQRVSFFNYSKNIIKDLL